MRRKARCPYCRQKHVDPGYLWFEKGCQACGVAWNRGEAYVHDSKAKEKGEVFGKWKEVPRGCLVVLETASWEEPGT